MNAVAQIATSSNAGSFDRVRALYSEQVDHLYRNAAIGFIATIVNSLILVIILRNVVPVDRLTVWFACLWLVTSIRLLQLSRYRRAAQRGTVDADRAGRMFLVGIACSGFVWGSAAVFLFPEQSIPHQLFIAFVLGGMIVGAAASFSSLMSAFSAYTVPAGTPLVLRFFSLGDEMHVAMGLMLLLFGILVTETARRVNRSTTRAFELRADITTAAARSGRAEAELVRYKKEVKEAMEQHAEVYRMEIRRLEAQIDDYIHTGELPEKPFVGATTTLEGALARLLIVDDQLHAVAALREFLETSGYATISATSGERALEIIAREAVHLVFVEISSHGMEGLGILRRIRQKRSDLPVIATGDGVDEEKAKAALGGGASDYVARPFDYKYLLRSISANVLQNPDES
jgi:CheY-like chemotaxis protein